MAQNNTEWNENQLRKYDFTLEDIPRYDCNDPNVDILISSNVSTKICYFICEKNIRKEN